MRRIEYGTRGEFIGIEGFDVPILRFGFVGPALNMPRTLDVVNVIYETEQQHGDPDFWDDNTVAEIPLTEEYVAVCGVAVSSWLFENPVDPRLNSKTAEYQRQKASLEIAQRAEGTLKYFYQLTASTRIPYPDFLVQSAMSR